MLLSLSNELFLCSHRSYLRMFILFAFCLVENEKKTLETKGLNQISSFIFSTEVQCCSILLYCIQLIKSFLCVSFVKNEARTRTNVSKNKCYADRFIKHKLCSTKFNKSDVSLAVRLKDEMMKSMKLGAFKP